jgi:hypothetical protein
MNYSMKTTEFEEQCALVEWARLHERKYPGLELLFHVPNGGLRDKATAGKLKAMGTRAGVPDLILPIARRGFNGLFLELKVGRNTLTMLQRHWLEVLAAQGY